MTIQRALPKDWLSFQPTTNVYNSFLELPHLWIYFPLKGLFPEGEV